MNEVGIEKLLQRKTEQFFWFLILMFISNFIFNVPRNLIIISDPDGARGAARHRKPQGRPQHHEEGGNSRFILFPFFNDDFCQSISYFLNSIIY